MTCDIVAQLAIPKRIKIILKYRLTLSRVYVGLNKSYTMRAENLNNRTLPSIQYNIIELDRIDKVKLYRNREWRTESPIKNSAIGSSEWFEVS